MAELDKEYFEVMQYTGAVFASEYNRKQERREVWVAKEREKREKEREVKNDKNT